MNNDLETIAKRYWEIYNSFDGQTHLIDLEIETINMLVEAEKGAKAIGGQISKFGRRQEALNRLKDMNQMREARNVAGQIPAEGLTAQQPTRADMLRQELANLRELNKKVDTGNIPPELQQTVDNLAQSQQKALPRQLEAPQTGNIVNEQNLVAQQPQVETPKQPIQLPPAQTAENVVTPQSNEINDIFEDVYRQYEQPKVTEELPKREPVIPQEPEPIKQPIEEIKPQVAEQPPIN